MTASPSTAIDLAAPGLTHASTTSGSSTFSLKNVRSPSGIRWRKRFIPSWSSVWIGRISISSLLRRVELGAVSDDPVAERRKGVVERDPAGGKRHVAAGEAQLLTALRPADDGRCRLGGFRWHDVVFVRERVEHVRADVAEVNSPRADANAPGHECVSPHKLLNDLAERRAWKGHVVTRPL